jgi:hypothetical protein
VAAEYQPQPQFQPGAKPARLASPPLHPAVRWGFVVVVLVAAGLRLVTMQLDPGLFLQAVLSFMGLVIASRRFRGDTRGKAMAQPLRVAGLAADSAALLLSPFFSVPAIAPFVAAFMVLMFAYMATQFGCFLRFVLLVLLAPIAVWAVIAIRSDLSRQALLHPSTDQIASATLRSPDGARTVELESPAELQELASLLDRAAPLYPNHEGLTEAWSVQINLRDRTTVNLLIGHGTRSRAPTWIELGPAHDYAVDEDYDTTIRRLVR